MLEMEPVTSDSKNSQHHRVTGTLASQSGTDEIFTHAMSSISGPR